jgi:hypothetical protein
MHTFRAAKARSDSIDRQIQKDARKLRKEIKILCLGELSYFFSAQNERLVIMQRKSQCVDDIYFETPPARSSNCLC